MKFLAITLITHLPDPITGRMTSSTDRLRQVVSSAVRADARQARFRALGLDPVFGSLEDAIERSSILVGSPQQIIDKVHRYHKRLGHEVMHLHADADGLADAQHRASLELFFEQIAPVLRREIPSRPFPQTPVEPVPASPVPA